MTRNKKLVKMMALAVAASTVATSVPAYAAFDATYYAQQNPDVVAAIGTKPADLETHYNVFGKKEGRAGSADEIGSSALRQLFDAEYYAKLNPDVAAVYGNDANALFSHFLQFGIKEGRKINPYFDVNAYKKAYPDLVAAFGDDIAAYYNHFATNGIKEHRTLGGFPAEKIVPGGVAVASSGGSSSSSSGGGGGSSKPAPKPADTTPAEQVTPTPDPTPTPEPEPEPEPEVVVPSIEGITLANNDSDIMKIKNIPEGYSAIEWSSSDKTIATVMPVADADGVVCGKITANNNGKTGDVTITAKLVKDEEVITVTGTVTVVEATFKLDKTELKVALGDSAGETLTANPKGSIASGTVTWSTSDSAIATVVSGAGNTATVKAVKAGVATITASITDANGKAYTATCTVTVTQPSVEFDTATLSIGEEDTAELTITTVPANAPVTITVEDGTIASYAQVAGTNKYTVRGRAAGTTKITAKINVGGSDYTSDCVVNVSKLTPALTLEESSLSIDVGGSGTILVKEQKPASGSVSYSSADQDIATVSTTGVVSALKPGKTTITIKLKDPNNGKELATANCAVTVCPTVSISAPTNSVVVGSNITDMTATATSGYDVVWLSTNPAVATVDDNGKVTGVKAGTTDIIAKIFFDGKEITAKKTVTVTAASGAGGGSATEPSGGSDSTGGTGGSGGTDSTGGSDSTGGTGGSGGTDSTGGTGGTGGSDSTGGTGGSDSTGGTGGTGGTDSTGGSGN